MATDNASHNGGVNAFDVFWEVENLDKSCSESEMGQTYGQSSGTRTCGSAVAQDALGSVP